MPKEAVEPSGEFDPRPDETWWDEYQEYLVETGQEAMTESDRRIKDYSDVDEWNEKNEGGMKMPYEEPFGYVDYGGAPVPMPYEWTPEELGYDDDGYPIEEEEPYEPFLPDK